MIDKPISHTRHLEERLVLRSIDPELPTRIIRQPDRVFHDTSTGYRIAIGRDVYLGRRRLMMAAYEELEDEDIAVTVHPFEEADVAAELRCGRWKA